MPDFYDPTSDVQTEWASTGAAHYTEIDEGIRYPNEPTLAGYVSTNANNAIDEWGFPTVTGSPPAIHAWLYVETGSNATIVVSFQQGGVERATVTVPVNTTKRWVSCDWQSPSGDLSTLTIEVKQVKVGGGAATYAYVYAAYLSTFNLDKQVGFSEDDAEVRNVFLPAATKTRIGNYVAVVHHTFARWIGVTYEGTVDVSYIEYYSDGSAGSPLMNIYGVDEDNPPAPTSIAEFNADPLTTAFVPWDGLWTDGSWNQSPSCNGIFQELVDTHGPFVNTAIMVQVKNDGSASGNYNYGRQWDYNGNLHGPKLHIEYTAVGGPGWYPLQFTEEPPTPNAWNQIKQEAGVGYVKILFEGE